MDNYLSSRWPKGPGVQPPPVPSLTPQAPVRKKPKWSARRWAVSILCVVLCLALLGGVSFWAVSGLAELLAGMELPDRFEDPGPWHSRDVSYRGPDWSADDLPWGEPDPSVQLSVSPGADAALSGREVYQAALPSIVYIEAQEKGSFGLVTHAGAGVIVTRSGYVLTNYHIIDETDQVRVILLTDPNRAYHDAQVIGFDKQFDIAVLKFEGQDLTPAQLGDSVQLAVGDPVYALGNPMGNLVGSMTEGIVSAVDRESEVDNSGMGMIQTSAALNPGNSGGALLNQQGQVVGITSAKISGLERESGESVENAVVIENLGLALPMTDILPFVNHILATGKSWRPSIGITCSEAEVDGRTGIRVATVDEDVPAQEAGLREGDLIVSANGAAVATLAQLRREIYRTGADQELHCIVVRDGAEVAVSFRLIDRMKETE